MDRRPYPSDLSDEHWALIEPMITAWKQDRVARSATGDPGACDLREVVNAIFYQNRTGCQWRYLPHDFPGLEAVVLDEAMRWEGPQAAVAVGPVVANHPAHQVVLAEHCGSRGASPGLAAVVAEVGCGLLVEKRRGREPRRTVEAGRLGGVWRHDRLPRMPAESPVPRSAAGPSPRGGPIEPTPVRRSRRV